MREYSNLSPYEFQNFVADLLQAEERRPYRRFRPPDAGIDLVTGHKGDLHVVQCRNYSRTPPAGLVASLRKEVARIRELAPSSYRVVTTVPGSKDLHDEVAQMFAPLMPSDGLVALDELESLVSRHPDVEQRHVKLWLSSVAPLDAVLHRGAMNRTDALVEQIQRELPAFVVTRAFYEARRILRRERVLLIAGEGGVGKTTLAKMLLLTERRSGHAPVQIERDIGEAWDLFKTEEPQFFYYDDFLGRTNLVDRLRKNEDTELWRFIQQVRSTPKKLFVMTTRDYILEQAKTAYDRLREVDRKEHSFILQIGHYSRLEKARVFYNHAHQARLPAEARTSLVVNAAYAKIVDHKNYMPRLVEMICSAALRAGADASFGAQALAALEKPDALWEEAFTNHFTQPQLALVLVLATLPEDVRVEDLRDAWNAYCDARGIARRPGAFDEALRVLEPSFARITVLGDERLVAFRKPSIADFAQRYLDRNADEVPYLIASATAFEQPESLWALGRRKERDGRSTLPHIARAVDANIPSLTLAIQRHWDKPPVARVHLVTMDGEFPARPPDWHEERVVRTARIAAEIRELEPLIVGGIRTVAHRWRSGDIDLVTTAHLLRRLRHTGVALDTSREWAAEVIARTDQVVVARLELIDVDALHYLQESWPELVDDETWEAWRQSVDRLVDNALDGILDRDEVEQLEYVNRQFDLGHDQRVERAREEAEERERERREEDADEEGDDGDTATAPADKRRLDEARVIDDLFAHLAVDTP